MPIYQNFLQRNQHKYNQELQQTIARTVDQLQAQDTDIKHPGMLLGKIQSGKTRTFIGVIALAFDSGYDVAVVLTKGTKALAIQTLLRLESEFNVEIENDEIKVYDILQMPQLTPYILDQKLIIVVKKEDDNLRKLNRLFHETYHELSVKKVLMIDDEADFASVGYRRDTRAGQDQEDQRLAVIAELIDHFRQRQSSIDFLQVTATPYSLLLQPTEITMQGIAVQPLRPKFVELVPIHENYIGGEFYFEQSQQQGSVASYLFEELPEKEVSVLKRRYQQYLDTILNTPNLRKFREAIMNFIVGGAVRRFQQVQLGHRNYKCSFILHTETANDAHKWQEELITTLIDRLQHAEEDTLRPLVIAAYDRILPSVRLVSQIFPEDDHLLNDVMQLMRRGIGIKVVNSDSDKDIRTLLDNRGQLRLDNPLNIFVGGQILDRGLTIDNLIGFFYARNPQKFQQDTVLQHSRMYGSRSQEDLSVTRFYTTARIYLAMKSMHESDVALRAFFNNHTNNHYYPILERGATGIIPCNPNKIAISNITALKPFKRLLPIGFQTKARTTIQPSMTELEAKLVSVGYSDDGHPFVIDMNNAMNILRSIENMYEYNTRLENEDYKWDLDSIESIIRYLASLTSNEANKNKCYVIVKSGRNASRKKDNGAAYGDAPDNGQTDSLEAKAVASQIPCILLLKQNGLEANGWRGAEFYWPVIYAPGITPNSVFSSKQVD